MTSKNIREIPYNYTSADDSRIIRFLFGQEVLYSFDKMRFKYKGGRMTRLLMRIIGELFIVRRNPFVYHELVHHLKKRNFFISKIENDLELVSSNSKNSAELCNILKACRESFKNLKYELSSTGIKQKQTKKAIGAIIGEDNICFDPFSIVSHVTDATDWRMFMPFAIARPCKESQVAPLLKTIGNLGLNAIPRGGGTGLTGGSVPVGRDCVVINTEKLNRIRGIITKTISAPEGDKEVRLIDLETGVVTGNAMAFAEKKGFVFATDPTSSWACSIGGNIAENAGGKTAVLWGTAIDNIWSFKIAIPGGRVWKVTRVDHPLRKILPDDIAKFNVVDIESGKTIRTIVLHGTEIRKQGLGKDITNKALNGLPGVQKEGCDGIITSAEFILHKAYPHKLTACLEFFGSDMDEAALVIQEISRSFVNKNEEALMALEHFDEEYIRAIGYKTKDPARKNPKAVLLIDMVGHTNDQLDRARIKLEALLEPYPNTSVFFAKTTEESTRFWQDRKKLGAIARRTNAFKLNEDIVLPIPALAEFSDFVDQYNIEEQRENQKSIVWQMASYMEDAVPKKDPQWLSSKIPMAKEFFRDTQEKLSLSGRKNLQDETHLKKLMENLGELFTGYGKITGDLDRIYMESRACLIVIATHMHAGDGNVHVNIPVFSNDRDMMIRAAETADSIMAKTIQLGGVVSGEHGIGFTKIRYIEKDRIQELDSHRRNVDPGGIMNPGKLSDLSVPDKIFTPSFNLLKIEADILQHASLGELADGISRCIRCGKCKADCCVFYPAGNLFFHPRNKNLAIGSLIEALLYEAQRSRSTKFTFLQYLEEIADHCTICHKCANPCPVDIDTGEISILERKILESRKFKHTAPATGMTLKYLGTRSPVFNAAFRKIVIRWGSITQRLAWRALKPFINAKKTRPGPLTGLINSPVTPASRKTMRRILPPSQYNQVLVFNAKETEDNVFYFPGCGSERLFSQIGKASLYILLKSGVSVVLPPPFLCCGYPAKVNAKAMTESREVLRAAIIFTQIREMLADLNFSACLVSCGTCMDSLTEQRINTIFDAPLMDVSKFVLDKGIKLSREGSYLYHRPCHDSLEGEGMDLITGHGLKNIEAVPHCCSEAGTMSMSRPDISWAMRRRKAKTLANFIEKRKKKTPVILTNCPSCVQGLGRHPELGIRPRHLAVEIAISMGGSSWEKELKKLAAIAEPVNF